MSDARRPTRWQYRSEWIDEDVDALGLEGWEAYAVTSHPYTDSSGWSESPCQWHLRRPLPDEAT